MVKKRINIWVSPEFDKRIKEIQKKIMRAKGENISTVDISDKMIPNIKDIEKKLLEGADTDFNLKLE